LSTVYRARIVVESVKLHLQSYKEAFKETNDSGSGKKIERLEQREFGSYLEKRMLYQNGFGKVVRLFAASIASWFIG